MKGTINELCRPSQHATHLLPRDYVHTEYEVAEVSINPHETARYGEIASAILNFFVCCMEMG